MKQGWLQIKKTGLMNILVIFQLSIVYILLVCVSSIVNYYYQDYMSFSKYLDGQGWICQINAVKTPGDNSLCRDSAQLESYLNKADVTGCYDLIFMCTDAEEKDLPMQYLGYDDEIIRAYTPKLEQGQWLNEVHTEGTIPAVITPNTYGITLGDVITLKDENGLPYKVEIVGMLKDGARVVGVQGQNITYENDYRLIYSDYHKEADGLPTMFINIEDVRKQYPDFTSYFLSYLLLVQYNDDISPQEIVNNDHILDDVLMLTVKRSCDDTHKSSIEYLSFRLSTVLPVLICAFVLAMISAVCVNAIVVKQQMRTYAVYSICGLGWRQCIRFHLMHVVFDEVLAFVLMLGAMTGLLHYGILDQTSISIGWIQLGCCLILSLIYGVLALVLPYLMLCHSSPKEVLVNNRS